MSEQQLAHEEELARFQQLNARASQEIVNQEAVLRGNIAQLQTQLLEAQSNALSQCAPTLHHTLTALFVLSCSAAAMLIAAKESQIFALEAAAREANDARQAVTARVARVRCRFAIAILQCTCAAAHFRRAIYVKSTYILIHCSRPKQICSGATKRVTCWNKPSRK
jgi:hypothetical protein